MYLARNQSRGMLLSMGAAAMLLLTLLPTRTVAFSAGYLNSLNTGGSPPPGRDPMEIIHPEEFYGCTNPMANNWAGSKHEEYGGYLHKLGPSRSSYLATASSSIKDHQDSTYNANHRSWPSSIPSPSDSNLHDYGRSKAQDELAAQEPPENPQSGFNYLDRLEGSSTSCSSSMEETVEEPPDEWYGKSNPMSSWEGYNHPQFGGYLESLQEDPPVDSEPGIAEAKRHGDVSVRWGGQSYLDSIADHDNGTTGFGDGTNPERPGSSPWQ